MMKHFKKLLKNNWQLLLILFLGAFLGLFQLDNLPAEMWGDATAHYTLAQAVRHGFLFFNYQFGGDGPIYTYLVVFISWFLGLSFYTLKFTSVIVYLLFIFFMYLLTDQLFKKKEITYIASFLSAVSFWSVTFARQPHARMLVPLFIAVTLFFAVKKKTAVSGIFLGLGMYTQASFWAMPLVFWKHWKILLIGFIVTIPLLISFYTGNVGFFTNQSYFGEKLAVTDHYTFSQIAENLASNVSANFFAFITRGDEGFRINVPDSPQVDTASALFFFIGFFLLLRKSIKEKKMKYVEFIILPFLFIQIPSLLDIHNPLAQPNIGRMIGVIPFGYITTAYGLTTTWRFVINRTIKDKQVRKVLYFICIMYLLLVIAAANIYKYFIVYPYFLPDQNTPFDKIITQTINTFSFQTHTIIIGSSWGAWGQPEQQAIIDEVNPQHSVTFIQPYMPKSKLCPLLNNKTVVITNPTDTMDQTTISTCGKTTTAYILQKNSFQVAKVIEIK